MTRRGIADRLSDRLLAIFIWLMVFTAIAFPKTGNRNETAPRMAGRTRKDMVNQVDRDSRRVGWPFYSLPLPAGHFWASDRHIRMQCAQ